MAQLDTTPGGLLLPSSTRVADVLPGLANRTVAWRRGRGAVPTAPGRTSGRGAQEGPLVSYQGIYDTQPNVAAVVNRLVRHGARVPFTLHRAQPDGHMTPLEGTHPAWRPLRQPLRGAGPMTLKQWLMFGVLVDGYSVNAIGRDQNNLPVSIVPLDRRYVTPYRQRGNVIDRWITAETGQSIEFLASDIVYFSWWSQTGLPGQLGISPLEQLGATIRLDDAARRHSYAQLATGMHPTGAFQLPADVVLDDNVSAALRRVIDAWSGVDVAGTPILARGAEWKTFAPNAVDAALIETRQVGFEETCLVYDCDPRWFGVGPNTKGYNRDALHDLYAIALAPVLDLLAESLQMQLINPVPDWEAERIVVRADLTEFLRGSPMEWAQALNLRVAGGGLTLNERRDLDGMPRFDDPKADEPLISDNNMHPLSQVGSNLLGQGGNPNGP